MIIKFYDDVNEFLDECGLRLEENETENGLMLGLCLKAKNAKEQGEEFPINLVGVWDEDILISTAIQTPPHNLVISNLTSEEVAKSLSFALKEKGYSLPGVVGQEKEASTFAKQWKNVSGLSPKLLGKQRIYELNQVQMPEHVSGVCREARLDDAETIAQWYEAFSEEVLGQKKPLNLESAKNTINNGNIYVWEDQDTLVSMAVTLNPTPNGIRINSVYTPPEHRGHAFAAANVATICQEQLDQGRRPFLYADNDTPASNAMYKKIGFNHVSNSELYTFEHAHDLIT